MHDTYIIYTDFIIYLIASLALSVNVCYTNKNNLKYYNQCAQRNTGKLVIQTHILKLPFKTFEQMQNKDFWISITHG